MIVAMTIAGSDPSGGAGLQADLKTFHQHGLYGTSVVTLLTVQNTLKVESIEMLAPEFVLSQLDAVITDIPPTATKIGALGNAAMIEAIAERARHFSFPLVIDPVMVSKHGDPLIDDQAVQVLRRKLLPQAFLLTPNVLEAAKLAEMEIDTVPAMEQAAAIISQLGAQNVLIKGGSLKGDSVDVLWTAGAIHLLPADRIDTTHTHGTGCVFSAAITARLAKGENLLTAVKAAKRFITTAIQNNPGLGQGHGPVNMHVKTDIQERPIKN
jgi:hydroxymethylpyrimidine/phosphomethylpyrimidine kinase